MQAEPLLSDDEQKVWDILATPYVPPSMWDNIDIHNLVNEIKMAMCKEPIYQTEKLVHYSDLGMTREEFNALR